MRFIAIALLLSLSLILVGCLFDNGGLDDSRIDELLRNESQRQQNHTIYPANGSLNNSLNNSFNTSTNLDLNKTQIPNDWPVVNNTPEINNTAPEQQPPRRLRVPTPFVPVPLSDYQQFLQNPQVVSAINLSNLTAGEHQQLLEAITQLENNDTFSWSEFDGKEYWSADGYWTLSIKDTRKIWLRRLAFSLFQELHKNVPWSILDYSDSELKYLLSYCVDKLDAEPGFIGHAPYAHYSCQSYLYYSYGKKVAPDLVFEPNPLRTNEISLEVLNGSDFLNQRELIDQTILQLRAMRWSHIQTAEDEDYLLNGRQHSMTTTMDRLYSLKRGGSGWNSIFLGAMLRGWNVPVHVGAINGHGSVQFPTEDIGMFSGDWIHGWPSGLPIEMSYLSNAQFDYIFSLPVCSAQVESDKIVMLRILSLYNTERYSGRVYFDYGRGYCYSRENYLNYLVNNATKTVDQECLDGSDPNKGSWYPAFDQSEMNDWTAKLAADAEESKICG